MDNEAVRSGQQADNAPKKIKKKKKRSAKYYLTELLVKFGITGLVLWLLLEFVVMISVCHDNTAYPMIKDGDFCLTYRLAELHQGDEVTYTQDNKVRLGRVIAFGGDTVDIRNDSVSVNGLNIAENVVYPTDSQGSDIEFPYQIPEDCVFVLNDYRSDLSDSRTYGGIPLSDVKGVVVFIMRRRGI